MFWFLKLSNQGVKMNITHNEIDNILNKWKNGLLEISKSYKRGGEYQNIAAEYIENLYNYINGQVLFKPTLASEKMFRDTFEGAMSYFISGNKDFPEDLGFALNSWQDIKFVISGYITEDKMAMVMGNKILIDTAGKKTIANFTMGFTRKPNNGDLIISLHHSSLPFVQN